MRAGYSSKRMCFGTTATNSKNLVPLVNGRVSFLSLSLLICQNENVNTRLQCYCEKSAWRIETRRFCVSTLVFMDS